MNCWLLRDARRVLRLPRSDDGAPCGNAVPSDSRRRGPSHAQALHRFGAGRLQVRGLGPGRAAAERGDCAPAGHRRATAGRTGSTWKARSRARLPGAAGQDAAGGLSQPPAVALAAAGFKQRFACERDCANPTSRGKTVDIDAGNELGQGRRSWPGQLQLSADHELDGRMWTGTLSKGGQDVVLLYTRARLTRAPTSRPPRARVCRAKGHADRPGDGRCVAGRPGGRGARWRCNGICFDTGKAELKPESRPQLDEMGATAGAAGAQGSPSGTPTTRAA